MTPVWPPPPPVYGNEENAPAPEGKTFLTFLNFNKPLIFSLIDLLFFGCFPTAALYFSITKNSCVFISCVITALVERL